MGPLGVYGIAKGSEALLGALGGDPDEQYRKLAVEATGKRSMADMDSAEASKFIDALRPKAQQPVKRR